jgi:hypothetical protein
MRKKKNSLIRRQRPVRGGRDPLPSCVLHEIRQAVEKEAMRYGVSKSFVIACILKKAFNIDDKDWYQE